MPKWIYAFGEADPSDVELLGGKGANLAAMTALDLPVPPGFTITTDAWRAFNDTRSLPEGLSEEIDGHLRRIGGTLRRYFGDPKDPLLVSVRSGSPRSMPGMMDTILNVGLTHTTVNGLAAQTGDRPFAWDCYRRLIEMFSETVLKIPRSTLDQATAKRRHAHPEPDAERSASDLIETISELTGEPFPKDPRQQLELAIETVFRSWGNDRACAYRLSHRIPDDLGTAVTVQAMVFGNRGRGSGTGVVFTRNPLTGENSPFGDFLPQAQGEDVVAGVRNPLPLVEMEQRHPRAWRELQRHMSTLEEHFRDMCDIEFTVEKERLWLLQCRVGKRSAVAEWVMAADMVQEGLIDEPTALRDRLTLSRLDELLRPSLRAEVKRSHAALTQGIAASPGAAVGQAILHPYARGAEEVILVRKDTTPDDYQGMVASRGILTTTGGANSHAAVVARAEGKPAVCGASEIEITPDRFAFRVGENLVRQWDWITIDGNDGTVYLGRLDTESSILEAAVRGDESARSSAIWRAYCRFNAPLSA
ncbi:MAG: pyruvate, orthophosphate dikinase [Actinomycetota bacterium]|jgi:pyruvate,orthophosphate dikinase|nr:pyruvate, orthophosphate dikinase [Actinomycetota bacterium]